MPGSSVALVLVFASATLDTYLDTGGVPVAEGFGSARAGRDAVAIAAGRVAFSGPVDGWGHVVAIEHVYYENAAKLGVMSIYARTERSGVAAGSLVKRGDRLARAGKVHLELHPLDSGALVDPTPRGKSTLDARAFIDAHRTLFTPHAEENLVLVDRASYELRHYSRGALLTTLEIGLGQEKGQKRVQGDLKTPKGMYFVISKKKGEFPGPFGGYFGGHWIKINYPNPYDAEYGVDEELISGATASKIRAAWAERKPTVETTRLGGGIGFHGWISDWDGEGGAHLSWGCVVLHNEDMEVIFDRIPVGTMVVIL